MLLLFTAKCKPTVPGENREVPHVQGILETSTQQRALKPKATTRDTMHYGSQSNSQKQLQKHWGFFWGRKGLHLIPSHPQNKVFSGSNFLSGSQAMDKESAGIHPNTVLQPPLLTDKSEREHLTLSQPYTYSSCSSSHCQHFTYTCRRSLRTLKNSYMAALENLSPNGGCRPPKSCSQGKRAALYGSFLTKVLCWRFDPNLHLAYHKHHFLTNTVLSFPLQKGR